LVLKKSHPTKGGERESELESRKIISKCKANKFKKIISKRKEKQTNRERGYLIRTCRGLWIVTLLNTLTSYLEWERVRLRFQVLKMSSKAEI